MKLCIIYSIDGKIKQCSESNEDLTLCVSEAGERYTVRLHTQKTVKLLSVTAQRQRSYKKTDRIFLNGYQSWTDSREVYAYERLKNIKKMPAFLVRKYAFDKYGDAFFKRYERDVLHSYDVSYLVGEDAFSVFSVNTENAYLIVNHHVRANKIVFESDVAGLEVTGSFQLFDFYFSKDKISSLASRCLGVCSPAPLFGYTSWYNHYQNIDEQKINYSLDRLDGAFDLFQIDDGYEKFVGDWLAVDENKFPNGLQPVLDKIHQKGIRAGIWLAPFSAERKSALFHEHRDWFLKDERGELLCGNNWSGFYALDFYNRDARSYIERCLSRYRDMGFDFFKLDFLYCVCVATPANKTRAQVSREAYSFIREVLGDKLILGCGAIPLSAAGIFDYLRVGPDVSLAFDDVWFMRFMHREHISTKVTLQNTIFRSFLDGTAFGNDPDVFLLREGVKMNEAQKKSLTVLNALFGRVMMTSDDICDYGKEQRETLDFALSLFKTASVLDYFREGDKIVILLNQGQKIIYHIESGVSEWTEQA